MSADLRADLTREAVYIDGPRGRLAGELCYPDTDAISAVLITNPHPLMGGAVNNNVVKRLAMDLPARGYVTLRFDYGGVGHSGGEPVDVAENMRQFWETGTSPADPQMAQEVGCVADWLSEQFDLPRIGVGYSFGAYALLPSAKRCLDAFVMISPTVARHDFSSIKTADLPIMVIFSDDDFATPVEVTRQWLEALDPPAKGCLLAGGEHFYRGLESRIVDLCSEFISQTLSERGGRR